MYFIYFLIYLISALCYTKLSNYFFFFSPRKNLLHPFHLENTFNLTYDHVAAFL